MAVSLLVGCSEVSDQNDSPLPTSSAGHTSSGAAGLDVGGAPTNGAGTGSIAGREAGSGGSGMNGGAGKPTPGASATAGTAAAGGPSAAGGAPRAWRPGGGGAGAVGGP